MLNLFLLLSFSYLIGSIPWGLLLTQWAKIPDIRQQGSGNIGSSNVLRTGGKKLAFFTLVLDVFKGFIAVWAAFYINEAFAPLAGLCAICGHIFPIWLKLRGGKGVAPYFGVMLGLSWITALCLSVIWVSVIFLTRFASLASLVSVFLSPFILYFLGENHLIKISLVMMCIVFISHRQNILRLVLKKELKIMKKEGADAKKS